eukprot:Lithocolla_globosa_v1_NODE_8641_length_797_cov_10.502695.p2 type:complete len:119 gc:universal NODE_8641_length_797_cov_10.502695:264-620(+)
MEETELRLACPEKKDFLPRSISFGSPSHSKVVKFKSHREAKSGRKAPMLNFTTFVMTKTVVRDNQKAKNVANTVERGRRKTKGSAKQNRKAITSSMARPVSVTVSSSTMSYEVRTEGM